MVGKEEPPRRLRSGLISLIAHLLVAVVVLCIVFGVSFGVFWQLTDGYRHEGDPIHPTAERAVGIAFLIVVPATLIVSQVAVSRIRLRSTSLSRSRGPTQEVIATLVTIILIAAPPVGIAMVKRDRNASRRNEQLLAGLQRTGITIYGPRLTGPALRLKGLEVYGLSPPNFRSPIEVVDLEFRDDLLFSERARDTEEIPVDAPQPPFVSGPPRSCTEMMEAPEFCVLRGRLTGGAPIYAVPGVDDEYLVEIGATVVVANNRNAHKPAPEVLLILQSLREVSADELVRYTDCSGFCQVRP